jgi:cytochrome c553
MRAGMLASVVLLGLPIGICNISQTPRPAVAAAPEAPGKADAFRSTVRPVLAAKCAPCHEPGGKMYSKLPFDRPETISSHASGVLRRLKGADREAVERWLESLPPAE